MKARLSSHFAELLNQKRGFLPLLIGDIVSTTGFAVFLVSTNYLVFTTTYSALAITYVGIVSFVPTIVFGLFAGAFVDRSNRRHVMIICDIARALIVAIIPIWMILKGFDLTVIIAVALLVNVFSTIFRPAARSIMPQIVQTSWIQDANGLMSALESLANSASLAFGGAMIVALGASLSLFYNSFTYLISACMIFLIIVPSSLVSERNNARPIQGPDAIPVSSSSRSAATQPSRASPEGAERSRRPPFISDVRGGMSYLLRHKGILEMTLFASAVNFFFTLSFNFLVVYVTRFLFEGGFVYGILLATYSFGSALGALIIGRLNALRYAGKALITMDIIYGFSTLSMIFFRNTFFAGAMLFVTGFSIGLTIALYFSVIQTLVPASILGRVVSADEVGSYASIPLAQIAGGLLIQTFGIVKDFEIAGVGLILTGLISILLRDFRRIRSVD